MVLALIGAIQQIGLPRWLTVLVAGMSAPAVLLLERAYERGRHRLAELRVRERRAAETAKRAIAARAVEVMPNDAEDWLRTAAENGDIFAMHELGSFYYRDGHDELKAERSTAASSATSCGRRHGRTPLPVAAT